MRPSQCVFFVVEENSAAWLCVTPWMASRTPGFQTTFGLMFFVVLCLLVCAFSACTVYTRNIVRAPPRTSFQTDSLGNGEIAKKMPSDDWSMKNTSTRFFALSHNFSFRVPPPYGMFLERIGSEIHLRGCVVLRIIPWYSIAGG